MASTADQAQIASGDAEETSVHVRAAVEDAARITQQKLDFVNALACQRDGPSTDFEIVCSGTVFKVHRVIIGTHSQYFKRLCDGSFQESGERKVELRCDAPAAVKAMVEYFYNFDYEDPAVKAVGSTERDDEIPATNLLEAHCQVYVLADKYDIAGLSRLAYDKFTKATRSRACAARGDSEFFTEMADDFIPATAFIFKATTSSDRLLRLKIVDFWVLENFLLLHVDKERMDAPFAEAPDFATELVQGLIGEKLGGKRHSD